MSKKDSCNERSGEMGGGTDEDGGREERKGIRLIRALNRHMPSGDEDVD